MRLHLFSDVHLEVAKDVTRLVERLIRPSRLPGISAVLAGDIGKPHTQVYRDFIAGMASTYDKVFIVSGNHEYYTTPYTTPHMADVDAAIRGIANSHENVHFLDRTCVVHEGVRFMGCTLWTKPNPEISNRINDYNNIPELTHAKRAELFQRDVEWLKSTIPLKSPNYDATVVVTHHLPTFHLVSPAYQNHPVNVYFASNLEDLVEQADVWLCGHTHTAISTRIGKCRCYVNPIGYEHEDNNYQRDLVISLS